MKMFQAGKWAVLTGLVTVLWGCGGGSDGSSAVIQKGVFIDSAVEGIKYQTATQSGMTNAAGEFNYIAGETVTFSIGDIDLPPATAATVMTPMTLAGATSTTDTAAVNIARLLQTLDSDGDPTNGISISSEAHTAATGITTVTFTDTAAFETQVASAVPAGSVLVSDTSAIAHLEDTVATVLTTAQLMSGSWWTAEHDDGGPRGDGTTDVHCEEISSLMTIAVDSSGSWTVSGTDPVDGAWSETFPATAVTTDETIKKVVLAGADGQERTMFTFNASSGTISGQWQKLIGGNWSTHETFTGSAPSVKTIMSGMRWSTQHDDGSRPDGTTDDHASEVSGNETITVSADGAWTMVNPEGTFVFPASAVTINEGAHAVTLMDADGLGRTVLAYNPATNSIGGQWQKLYNGAWQKFESWTNKEMGTCSSSAVGNSIAGVWRSTGASGEFSYLLLFADNTFAYGEYDSTVQEPLLENGLEVGTYSYDSTTGNITFNVAYDDNTSTGGSSGVGSIGTPSVTDSVLSNGGTTLTVAGGQLVLNSVNFGASPVSGVWRSGSAGGEFSIMMLTDDGTFLYAENDATVQEPLLENGLEVGTYSYDSTTGNATFNVVYDDNTSTGGSSGAGSIGTPSVIDTVLSNGGTTLTAAGGQLVLTRAF